MGRIRGLFIKHPFHFDPKLATILANICCHKNFLPQGAPTSPILSNFICRRLDNQLLELATENRCKYTRYADDITISTNLKETPKTIAAIVDNKLCLSKLIVDIINANGFQINNSKTRYANKNNRHEVTGLIVNKKANVNRRYIRNIRAMLHAWEKFGIEKASTEHFEKYNYKNSKSNNYSISFEKKIIGKIGFVGFVKGKDDSTYKLLYNRAKKLSPGVKLSIIFKENESEKLPILYGEGKSDWKHLKKALIKLQFDGEFTDLEIKFKEYQQNVSLGYPDLIKICEVFSKAGTHKNIIICFFDRDLNKSIITNKLTAGNNPYKHWGNNVYSYVLPKPPHRPFDEVCIEHYYLDSEIKTKDLNGRRLYLANEFDNSTGKHKQDDIIYKEINKLKKPYPFIIDASVFDNNGFNIALSKDKFANYIFQEEVNYNSFSVDKFKTIFSDIRTIINTAHTSQNN